MFTLAGCSATESNSGTAFENVTIQSVSLDVPDKWSEEDADYGCVYSDPEKHAYIHIMPDVTSINSRPMTQEAQLLNWYKSEFDNVNGWKRIDSDDESSIYQTEFTYENMQGFIKVVFSGNHGDGVIAVFDSNYSSGYSNLIRDCIGSVKCVSPSKSNLSVNTGKSPTSNQNETSKTEPKKHRAGSYRVGKDLPAGEYKFFATGSGYFCVYPDTNKSKILENDNFGTCDYIEVSDGQLLEVSNAYFVAIDEASKTTELKGSGVYKVGLDIEPGEYNIKEIGASSGYYAILNTVDANVSHNIVDNDNFTGNSYIAVSEGQYLKISRASIEKAS